MEHLLAGGRARGIKCSPLYMLVHYRSESQTVESFLNLFPLILHIQPISTSDHFWLWKYVWILIDSQHLCRYYSNASHHLYLGYCNNCLWWTYSPVFYTAVSDPVSKKSDHVSPLQMLCCLSNSLRVKHLCPGAPTWSGSGLFDLVSSHALPCSLQFSCSLVPWPCQTPMSTPGHWHLLSLSENALPAAILLTFFITSISFRLLLNHCLLSEAFFVLPSIK